MNKELEKLTKAYEDAEKAFEDYKRRVNLQKQSYPVSTGYSGMTEDGRMLFPTEEEYNEYLIGE